MLRALPCNMALSAMLAMLAAGATAAVESTRADTSGDVKNSVVFTDYSPLAGSSEIIRRMLSPLAAVQIPAALGWSPKCRALQSSAGAVNGASSFRRIGRRRFRSYIQLMCGKFTQMMSWRQVRDLSDLLGHSTAIAPDEPVIGTPMRLCQVIHLDHAGTRANSAMRWGFVDRRAKSPLERPKHMHARAETIEALPTFAEGFANRRGILLAKTFNVGQELPNGEKIQHTITPRDGKPIAIAVIWEKWENRNEGTVLTFVMVTTAPNRLIATVTDRMPAILRPEDWPLWLGESQGTPAQAKSLLQTFEGDWEMAKQEKRYRRQPVPRSSQPALF